MNDDSGTLPAVPTTELTTQQERMDWAVKNLTESDLDRLNQEYPDVVSAIRLEKMKSVEMPLARRHAELAALAKARIKREADQ